jgi:DNA-binding transcriptional MerR regulator
MTLKISELEKETGVPQSTIRYYVKEGLLPKPRKINKSMSYYDESCIDRIALVRELQERKFYPLSVIRNIIKRLDEGANLNGLISLEDAIFRSKSNGADTFMTREELISASNIDEDLLDLAESLNLLIPYNKGSKRPYNHEDLNFARLIITGSKDLGIDLRDMEFYLKLGAEIVEKEIALRKKLVSGKTKNENLKITALLSEKVDDMRRYILRRLFQSKVKEMMDKSK